MDFTKIRVLVPEGSGKQSLAMIRGLKELGCHVTVVCTTKFDTCYVSNKPDVKILKPHLSDNKEDKLKFLLELVSSGKYDVLMPIGEISTTFVTEHEEEFSKYVKLACAPRDIYIKASNKQATFDQAIKSNIPCSYTRRSDQDIEDYLNTCKFPIIIKPRRGLGSVGFHKFERREDFWPYMKEKGLNPDDFVVQEFVRFDNYIGTLLYIDQKGNVCTSYAVNVLRWFPLDAGTAVLITTVDAHEILQYAGKLLKDMGWRGFADATFMIDKETGEPKLLEINGRIPASVKMAYVLGFNIARQFLEMVYNEDVIQYPENNKFGIYVRHFDSDLAWFFKSPNRFRAKPSWFSWKNTYEVLYSKDDKKPFFARLFQKVFEYKKIMKRKQH